ncbi:DUF4142 domain-containing protein [Spirosoma sp. BT702]|uniref:DUF4142 domain-containing protein n=1 Tax=Spirosoma profusum TaxID=2771354 RepID=A0A926XXP1_9BACT|nr:DUF4142 domain-containing protein [Spirosoma profusum]MBD2702624.1 DUF4142 domain-containing protein [Spirosoma profusum]
MQNSDSTARRDFFKKSASGTLALGVGMPLMSSLLTALSAEASPLADSTQAATEKEFRQGVIGPAQLSLVTSQIAVSKATNKYAKEFAGFELEEAKAVTSVLKDLGTPVPAMNAKAQATLTKIKTATGAAFDKAYIQAQLENHEFLRDLAQNYLKNSVGKTSPAESHTRHLATLALAVFKEHVALTKQILDQQLGGAA